MSALIIGGNGFVGLNIAAALLRRSVGVHSADITPPPERARQEFGPSGMFVEHALDVRDAEAVAALVATIRPAVVIYAAAVTPDLARELRSAAAIADVNIGGLARCLDAIAPWPSIRLVYVGSSAVFGRSPATEWGEDHPHSPRSLYGITKSTAEAILARWSALHARPTSIARLGWVFGPWERDTGHRCMLSAVHQLTSIARAGGTAVLARDAELDWAYAPDAGEAIARLAIRPPDGFVALNVGPERRWRLSEWCRLLADAYPGFRWEIGAEATVALHAETDDPPLAARRFAAAHGPLDWRGAQAGFADYLRWLSQEKVGLQLDAATVQARNAERR